MSLRTLFSARLCTEHPPGGSRRRRNFVRHILLLFFVVFAVGCPEEDADNDGVADSVDRCPNTTASRQTRASFGCSLADRLLTPEAMTDPLQQQITQLSGLFSDEPLLEESVLQLAYASSELTNGRDDLLQADPCSAQSRFVQARDSIAVASDAMDGFLAELLMMTHQQPAPEGDVDEISSEYLWWRARARELDRLHAETSSAADTAEAYCGAIASYEVIDGIVESVDPGKRAFTLRGGQRIVMMPMALYDHAVVEGVQVSSEVLRFNDGTTVTNYGTVGWDTVTQVPGIFDGECLRLKALPWGLNGVANSHFLDGYEDGNGVYQFEEGMQLLATGPLCPTQDDDNPWIKFAYRLTLSYNNGAYTQTLASSLTHNQDVWLPGDVNPNQVGTLIIEKLRYRCEKDPLSIYNQTKCEFESIVKTENLPVQIRDKYAFCDAVYEDTVFTLPPNDPSAWQPTRIVGVSGVPGPVTFHAEAKLLVNGNPGPLQHITSQQPFAVYRSDAGYGSSGTNAHSAVRWPHVTGSRNGSPYRYSCSVPELVRDRIDECSGGPDTFYRLPFVHGQSSYVGQGNNTPWDGMGDPPSHTMTSWQRWALDLSNPLGTDIVAARAGIVRDYKSNETVRCLNGETVPGGNPCPNFFGNYVAVEHSDGQWSWYMHMDPGTPAAANIFVGKQVVRGQKLGEVGLTGNTSGYHVHYQVTPPGNTGATAQVSYEMYTTSALTSPVSCQVPQVGQTYWSNNTP